uniref:SH2 domain-containing protein n=1 Tax=Rhabditophanes sp. KR3021 TaxID=114890 RepID=A0AC35TR14_9BILA
MRRKDAKPGTKTLGPIKAARNSGITTLSRVLIISNPGTMTHKSVEEMLQQEGSFLIRQSEFNNLMEFIVTVRWQNACSHLLLRRDVGVCYIVLEQKFTEPKECMDFYITTKTLITAVGYVLLAPFMKPE